jgi:hypothetical protein
MKIEMKRFIENRWRLVLTLTVLLAASCETDVVKPILSDDSKFTAPAITNTATSSETELLPENAGDPYETIQWSKSGYDGMPLATTYTVEIDKNEDFANPRVLATTVNTSTTLTVGQLNDMMLALGVPGFEKDTVYMRVKSVITGQPNAPLYSGVIERVATTFQNSECGTYCTIGIIGDASPGGWDTDVDLRLADPTKVDKHTWTTTLYLNTGAVKFRAQDGWDVNWGAASFPEGTGVQNGANIPIATAGYYKVTFNDETGAYSFDDQAAATYATVGLIGPAQTGGWDTDTNLTKDGTNPHLWTGTLTLSDGEAKFRADDAWTMNWGGDTSPSGYATKDGPNIPVAGATYFVRFNDATGEYSFMTVNRSTPYTSIGLVGPAQAGGWDADTDLTKNPANPYMWSKVLTVTEGESKFRADDAWTANWGATTFPSGKGVPDGPNIPTKAGTYFITFNSGTGEYTFLK